MVDPVTAGLIGWACGKLGDTVLKKLVSHKSLTRDINKTVAKWAKSLPDGQYVHPQALFQEVDPSTPKYRRPQYFALQDKLAQNELPKVEMWYAAFMESWWWVKKNLKEGQDFFTLDEAEASEEVARLAQATYDVCVQHESTFKKAVIDKLDGIDGKIDKLLAGGLAAEKKVKSLWPRESLPSGGPKLVSPFAGRENELRELTEAMNHGKDVVAVVGMAGQGKSCLVGEWYKRGARPPQGVGPSASSGSIGLFWRKVYESGSTFDRFIDDLYPYLTGEQIDHRQVTTIEKRAEMAVDALREKPCWIVLDGVERWLNRWAKEPDAGTEETTVDDRAGHEPGLDRFLQGAASWKNGSRLLLTTRVVPSALDMNLPVMIGQEHGLERLLKDLQPTEAVDLLKQLKLHGDENLMLQASKAYGCHAFAVHVLGLLIYDLYGGDVSRWQEVDLFEERDKQRDVGGPFARVIEHQPEDAGLLELVACSVGPAPVKMLGEVLGDKDKEVRKALAKLAKWQMVEFSGQDAEEHTVVRRFVTGRMGQEKVRDIRKVIAQWWAERDVPDQPQEIEQVRPLLRAVEHLAAAGDPRAAAGILFTKRFEESYSSVDGWLQAFGYLDEDIRLNGLVIEAYEGLDEKVLRELRNDLAMSYNNRGTVLRVQGRLAEAIGDYGRAIGIYEQLVEKEHRRELRNDLAACYSNRGAALRVQGRLAEAIENYGRAIGIYEQLVEKEDRLELRNNLAGCYNNRGNALGVQGRLAEAIEDFGRAIAIREQLVHKEHRLELRNDLASCYNNRGNALQIQRRLGEAIEDYGRAIEITEQLVDKEHRLELRWDLYSSLFNRAIARSQRNQWDDARADLENGAGLLRGLIGEGQSHVIESFLKTAGFACLVADQMGIVKEAVEWANDAMQWFMEEADGNRMNQVLLQSGAEFAQGIGPNPKLLSKNGLDGDLLTKFLEYVTSAEKKK